LAKAMQMTNRRLWADGALLLIALLWGATFVPIKLAVQQYSVLGFLGVRFLFALALLSMLSFPRLRATKMTRAQVGKGLLTGVLFLAGYVFQTYGLRYTGAGRAAFITGLNTIFVPLLLVILFRSRLQARPVLGTILATAGMAFLGMDGIATGSWHGDLLVLGGAVAFALHIICMGRWGTQCDPVLFTTVQVLAIAPLATLTGLLFDGPLWPIPTAALGAAAFTGLIVSGLGLLLQVWAQSITSPTHTAVILATEPVFGAFFGWLLAGELLTQAGFVGCALILLGMLAAESG
jgi:drug/metabolite transporter (DMT)-like permease